MGTRMPPRPNLAFDLSGRGNWKGEAISMLKGSISWGLLVAAILASGCSKHQPATAANPATNAVESGASQDAPAGPPTHRASAPVGASAIAAVVPDTGNLSATLDTLSQELRKYVVHTRSVPRNFEEFAAKSHLQAPPPPAGKKYAIKDQAVVLVKR